MSFQDGKVSFQSLRSKSNARKGRNYSPVLSKTKEKSKREESEPVDVLNELRKSIDKMREDSEMNKILKSR
jgi:hypothetical protein